jgi:hypothetical protein
MVREHHPNTAEIRHYSAESGNLSTTPFAGCGFNLEGGWAFHG